MPPPANRLLSKTRGDVATSAAAFTLSCLEVGLRALPQPAMNFSHSNKRIQFFLFFFGVVGGAGLVKLSCVKIASKCKSGEQKREREKRPAGVFGATALD